MTQFMLFLLYLFAIVTCTTTVQGQIQMADFQIFKGTEYIANASQNLIANITGKSVYSLTQCASKCLGNVLCETATYYIQTQICSLYQEWYGLGKMVNVAVQTASAIRLISRTPSVTKNNPFACGNMTVLVGYDLVGYDIQGNNFSNYSLCCEWCRSNNICLAFTWLSSMAGSSAMCYIKNAIPSSAANSAMVSAHY